MNALAAAGRIAVCLAFSIGLSAQTPTITVTPTGTAGVYTLAGQYTTQAQAHPPTGSVAFEDTTYSNAVLASAPFSSYVTSIVPNGSQPFASVSQYNSTILARDFDGDGKADVLFVDDTSHLNFFKGNGDGSFQAGIPDYSMSMPVGRLAAGDWDGDGKLDIAASATDIDTSSGPVTATILIRRGNGDGTFQAPVQLTEILPQSVYRATLQSGDFNGDGKLDLYSTLYSAPTHRYLRRHRNLAGVEQRIRPGRQSHLRTQWLPGNRRRLQS
ncbi:MAG: VCBS repeat-containing protein [Acidobacteriales bacterium]|nr:VCBS repeat-containing protein [Terriglobales bacterium]